MSTIHLKLSESSQKFVNHQVAELGLSAPEEYFEKLVEEEQKKKIDEYYYEKCQEAIETNQWTRWTPEYGQKLANEIELQYNERIKEGTVR
jgi:mRNA-degrading endonuclease RelE of RelBE toxin-antitoxin system